MKVRQIYEQYAKNGEISCKNTICRVKLQELTTCFLLWRVISQLMFYKFIGYTGRILLESLQEADRYIYRYESVPNEEEHHYFEVQACACQ